MISATPPHEDFEVINGVKYYHRLQQGCHEWHELRKGMITASTMCQAVTPATLKTANNDKTRQQVYQLAADRVANIPVDSFTSWAMERGHIEEVEARIVYEKECAPVQDCGFIINESLGFPVGFSPDGLVGDDGLIETKSRAPKFQVETIINHMGAEPKTPIPAEFMLQVQTGLFVTGRNWCDFNSYSNGMNMAVIRVYPDETYQAALIEAAIETEKRVVAVVKEFEKLTASGRVYPVKYIDHNEEISV